MKHLYACEYCGRISRLPEDTAEHELKCSLNPALRSCDSCRNQGAEGFPFGDRNACIAGIENHNEIEAKVLPCGSWERQKY